MLGAKCTEIRQHGTGGSSAHRNGLRAGRVRKTRGRTRGKVRHVFPQGTRRPHRKPPVIGHRSAARARPAAFRSHGIQSDAVRLSPRRARAPGRPREPGRASLRGLETAQGMFVDFPRLVKFYRDHLPFGATQIGKAYRNEISPRQGVIRLREFTQAEAEIFIDPRDKTHPKFKDVADIVMNLYSQDSQANGEMEKMSLRDAVTNGIIAHEFLAYCLALTQKFLVRVGVSPEKTRFRQHMKDEMAHYAADCWDAEILSDRFGWVEVVGIADRTDFDLKAHAKQSEKELSVYVSYDTPKKVEKFVVKPDMGVLGPRFKGKAGKVANALKALKLEELSGDVIEVTVNGEKIKVNKDSVKFETVTEEIHGENIIPHVIEPSFGIDRITYSLLEHSYFEEETKEKVDDEEEGIRIVLRLPPEVAPVQAAVLPSFSR